LSSMNKAGDSSKRELDQEIMSAWREAAEELGIRVEIPFILVAEDGETERYGGRVIDFVVLTARCLARLTTRYPRNGVKTRVITVHV
jgi:predicted NUDIX family NTP pyrophosphohydrolase